MSVGMIPFLNPQGHGTAWKADGKALMRVIDQLDEIASTNGMVKFFERYLYNTAFDYLIIEDDQDPAEMDCPAPDIWFSAADGHSELHTLISVIEHSGIVLQGHSQVMWELNELLKCLAKAAHNNQQFRLEVFA